MDPEVYDPASNRMVITYQTFVVRTPHHTILVDTCTGEDKGYPAPMDFPKQPWLDGFRAEGLKFEDIDYVFCTHLHIDHCGWNTVLRDGRWVPTFPKAKYIFHKREYAAWEAATRARRSAARRCLALQLRADRRGGPGAAGGRRLYAGRYGVADADAGHSPCHCCVNIRSGGQRASVTGDMMHHALQCREPEWSTIFDWDAKEAAASRRKFLSEVADTGTLILPIHFPSPTVGRVTADGERFRYSFVR